MLTLLAIASCTAAWWKDRGRSAEALPGQEEIRVAREEAGGADQKAIR